MEDTNDVELFILKMVFFLIFGIFAAIAIFFQLKLALRMFPIIVVNLNMQSPSHFLLHTNNPHH